MSISSFPAFRYEAPDRPHSFRLFLSSSDEVAPLRERVDMLVHRSFNPALRSFSRAEIQVVRWEDLLANRQQGESSNDVFIRAAKESHHTLVLLMTHLGQGTREEVTAVATETDRPLSILRFDPPSGYASGYDPHAIDEFVEPLVERHALIYARCGQADSERGWQGLVKLLSGVTLAARQRSDEEVTYSELRD